jgi:hypothetical protein
MPDLASTRRVVIHAICAAVASVVSVIVLFRAFDLLRSTLLSILTLESTTRGRAHESAAAISISASRVILPTHGGLGASVAWAFSVGFCILVVALAVVTACTVAAIARMGSD